MISTGMKTQENNLSSFLHSQNTTRNEANPINENEKEAKTNVFSENHDYPIFFDKLRDYFSPTINGIAIVGNTLAGIGLVTKIFPEKLVKFFDEKSEWFSKFVVPLSFASNGLEALSGKRLIEASLRFIPAISFWALPMFNFTYPMGLFSGSNTILSMIHKRLGDALPNNDLKENTKAILNTGFEVFRDFSKGQTNKEETNFIISSLTVLAGSIGGMVFGSQDRDTPLAKAMGTIRSIAGVAVDIGLFLKNNFHEKIVGLSCGTASLCNLALRWIPNENIAKAVNHLGLATDDFGQTYWAYESRRRNKINKSSKQTQKALLT